ncbi:MAG: OmpA family protein [Alphaproteobacteria bacterium]|nr:OmpA family protein [Alphaproteobacteria bacterium]
MQAILKICCVLVLLFCVPAMAEDEEGSKDHPRIPRLPGYEIQHYVGNDFGFHEFYTSADKTVKVEGRYWQIDYLLPEGKKVRGALEIVRNYENIFKAKGGGSYLDDVSNGGGTATVWMNDDNKESWMEISVSNEGEAYTLTIVEKAALQQQIELGSAQIAKELSEKGTVALYGILFDTAKSDIKPSSEPTLKAIADALKSAPNMNVEVGGHTDNVGGTAYNQTLSQARASAVQQTLISMGIKAERLHAKGYGDSVPLAGNDTQDGRAKNRRVQLTKLP